MTKLKIIMTGGGTAGHVTPNVALMPRLKELGYEIQYIGTKDGIEKSIIEKENIKYHAISSGKLRRYIDIKNFTDPFKVIKGIVQAAAIIRREKPNVVFSKGGFVSVPVVIGAHFCRVPVVAHESDITPGLANKLSSPYCTKICVTFPETANNIKGNKAVLTGSPIRKELFLGKRIEGLKICGFSGERPIILVIGGSLGSKAINDAVRKSLNKLLLKFDIIHVCGKGNIDDNLRSTKGYKQFDYVGEELPHLLNAADMAISRAGANAIFEFLALKKPNLLIPLSKKSSRGDQILNAASFEKNGYSMVIEEEEVNEERLLKAVYKLYEDRKEYINAMNSSPVKNGVENIIEVINQCRK